MASVCLTARMSIETECIRRVHGRSVAFVGLFGSYCAETPSLATNQLQLIAVLQPDCRAVAGLDCDADACNPVSSSIHSENIDLGHVHAANDRCDIHWHLTFLR